MTPVNEAAKDTEIPSCWRVGVHTSIAGSLAQSAEKAHALGCTAFQIFSTNPRMWKSRELAAEEVSAMARLRREFDLRPLVIHANYLLNLASPDPALRQRSIEAFREEIRRAAALRAEYLVLHPGSFRDGSPEEGIRTLARSIREAMRETPPDGVRLLIENTCGQGNILGGRFEELRDIVALLDGLPADCCLDTAHCFAAGMDLASAEGFAAMLAELERTVGLARVPVIHANDSRSALGSHRDWHEHIGRGGIGRDGFRRIVNDPALRDKTFILETPIEKPGDDRRNLRALRSLRLAESGESGTRGISSGHGFGRAVKGNWMPRALAPEVSLAFRELKVCKDEPQGLKPPLILRHGRHASRRALTTARKLDTAVLHRQSK